MTTIVEDNVRLSDLKFDLDVIDSVLMYNGEEIISLEIYRRKFPGENGRGDTHYIFECSGDIYDDGCLYSSICYDDGKPCFEYTAEEMFDEILDVCEQLENNNIDFSIRVEF